MHASGIYPARSQFLYLCTEQNSSCPDLYFVSRKGNALRLGVVKCHISGLPASHDVPNKLSSTVRRVIICYSLIYNLLA